jgi:hypothetical protein
VWQCVTRSIGGTYVRFIINATRDRDSLTDVCASIWLIPIKDSQFISHLHIDIRLGKAARAIWAVSSGTSKIGSANRDIVFTSVDITGGLYKFPLRNELRGVRQQRPRYLLAIRWRHPVCPAAAGGRADGWLVGVCRTGLGAGILVTDRPRALLAGRPGCSRIRAVSERLEPTYALVTLFPGASNGQSHVACHRNAAPSDPQSLRHRNT